MNSLQLKLPLLQTSTTFFRRPRRSPTPPTWPSTRVTCAGRWCRVRRSTSTCATCTASARASTSATCAERSSKRGPSSPATSGATPGRGHSCGEKSVLKAECQPKSFYTATFTDGVWNLLSEEGNYSWDYCLMKCIKICPCINLI